MGTITQTDFGYTGQRNNAGIGWMDYNARYYSPSLNHWVQPDTIIPNPGNPQDYNRYSYVRNNPIKYTDPSGHAACVDSECALGFNESSNQYTFRAGFENVVKSIANDWEDSNVNDVETMAFIADRAVELFNGNMQQTYATLTKAFMGGDGVSGLLAARNAEDQEPWAKFGDEGFHKDFAEGGNQVLHSWQYINIYGNILPGGYNPAGFDAAGQIGNVWHEWSESIYGRIHNSGSRVFGYKPKTFPDGNWKDFVLSEAAMDIGSSIASGENSIYELGNLIRTGFGESGGSNGRLQAYRLKWGPLVVKKDDYR